MRTLKSTRTAYVLLALLLSSSLAACGLGPSARAGSLQVVAAENFWGNLAAQLGGSRVSVNTILSNPASDPHDYESSAQDARSFATADYIIVNGAGYDDWAQKLIDANATSNRKVLNVAQLLNRKAGDNPHFWYNPDAVNRVADRIAIDYQSLDSAGGSDFQRQRQELGSALGPYRNLIAAIRQKDGGAPIAATESIFVYMAQALRLDLRSPREFMNAISQGSDPPAQTVAQFETQLSQRQVRALVFNRQTSSQITDRLQQLARQNRIPVVGVTEMLPAGLTFQDWQDRQLQALQASLGT
jgi:zinc/manganese transport system substrate-binding protein